MNRYLALAFLLFMQFSQSVAAQSLCNRYQSCNPVRPGTWGNCTLLTDLGNRDGQYFFEIQVAASTPDFFLGTFKLSHLRNNGPLMREIATGNWTMPRPASRQSATQFIMGHFNRRNSAAHNRTVFGMAVTDSYRTSPGGAFIQDNSIDLSFDFVFTHEKFWRLDSLCN